MMNIIEVTVQRRWGDGWPVVVEWHQIGVFLPVRSEGTLRLSGEQLAKLEALAYDPLAYGTLLGQALFTGQEQLAVVDRGGVGERQ